MDPSSATDPNNPQYHQHQQHTSSHQAYDPSQYQHYDPQFYYSYPYDYYQQLQNPSHQSVPCYYSYQHQSTAIHPPGVSVQPESANQMTEANSGSSHVQNPISGYYPQQGSFGPVLDATSSSRLPMGQPPSSGRGRRGGRHYRGGGRGRGGFRSASLSHGRGLGHGVGSSGPAPQAQGAPFWPAPRMAWCELCRVDCNTAEILEQHKNGKRHKKNMQVNEELQKLNKLITETQNQQPPNTERKPEVAKDEREEGSEDKQVEMDNLPNPVEGSEISITEPRVETEKNPNPNQTRGFKRSVRGGRGGKRPRVGEAPPGPAVALFCELCNVRCDTQVVFDSHLAGKKHLSNLDRFHGYQAILGAAVIQALCQANAGAASASFIPQGHHQLGFHPPHGIPPQSAPRTLPQGQPPAAILENSDQVSVSRGSEAMPAVQNSEAVSVNSEGKPCGNADSKNEFRETATVEAIPEPKSELASSELVPAPGCNTEESDSRREEPTEKMQAI